MDKGRLEAFSDGVIAILITIMVLELHRPEETSLEALGELLPVLSCYVLSFVYVGLYWNNHHHLLQACSVVDGRSLWANLFLLFWLSLIPFATDWMGEGGFASVPTALYGGVLIAAACAYSLLVTVLRRVPGQAVAVREASGTDRKGVMSVVIYAVAIAIAFVAPPVSVALYAIVAGIWFVPDRRVERALGA
jgi:uncharacterized membrane protein